MVARLELEKYKATIKGLTQFGDRRQGTDRNRAAIDWIEAQLKSYGCTNTERLKYVYPPPQPHRHGAATRRGRRSRRRAAAESVRDHSAAGDVRRWGPSTRDRDAHRRQQRSEQTAQCHACAP